MGKNEFGFLFTKSGILTQAEIIGIHGILTQAGFSVLLQPQVPCMVHLPIHLTFTIINQM